MRISLTSVNVSYHEYKVWVLLLWVLSSAKLQITDCSIIMNISLTNILKKFSPKIDPWEIPRLIFDHLL